MVRHRVLLPARSVANACLAQSHVASGSSTQGLEQRLAVLSLTSGSAASCSDGVRAHHTHARLSAHHDRAFARGMHASSALPQGLQQSMLPFPFDPHRKILSSMQLQGYQHFSANSGKPHSPALLLDKVETALRPRLEQAFRLHATALWQQHRFKVYAVGSLFAVWVTWNLARSIASVFIDVCGLAAQWGLLGIAITLVAAAAQVLRWRFSINPAAVYRKAMLQLNSNPGVLEVMGAPLTGSDMRAYVMTGGGAYLSKKAFLRPKIRSRRIQMIFPLHGSERSGMVSVEAKKRKGRHVFKLLAVDVRQGEGLSTSSQPARIYLQGNDVMYSRGDVLEQMRRPFLQASQLQPALDAEEEEEDERERDLLEAEAAQAVRVEEEARKKRAVEADKGKKESQKKRVETGMQSEQQPSTSRSRESKGVREKIDGTSDKAKDDAGSAGSGKAESQVLGKQREGEQHQGSQNDPPRSQLASLLRFFTQAKEPSKH